MTLFPPEAPGCILMPPPLVIILIEHPEVIARLRRAPILPVRYELNLGLVN